MVNELLYFSPTLSEKIAHSTVYHHPSHLSVDIQLGWLIKFREDSSYMFCNPQSFNRYLPPQPFDWGLSLVIQHLFIRVCHDL